jgi:hypothetical protein
LLIHYGASRIVNVIIDDAKKYVEKMKEFLQHYERFNSYDAFQRIEVRVALTNSPNCAKYTSMHEKRVITDSYSLFGSYNLTSYARCKNWESCYVADSVQQKRMHSTCTGIHLKHAISRMCTLTSPDRIKHTQGKEAAYILNT